MLECSRGRGTAGGGKKQSLQQKVEKFSIYYFVRLVIGGKPSLNVEFFGKAVCYVFFGLFSSYFYVTGVWVVVVVVVVEVVVVGVVGVALH